MVNAIIVSILLHLYYIYYFFNNIQAFINMLFIHYKRWAKADGFMTAA